MTFLIQAAIIIAAILIVVNVLSRRSTYWGKAWKKIGLVLLAILMIVAVLFPELTNRAAALVGVGRGADLLLYVTVVAFIFYALNNYLHQQDQRAKLFSLARQVAIMEAKNRDHNKGAR